MIKNEINSIDALEEELLQELHPSIKTFDELLGLIKKKYLITENVLQELNKAIRLSDGNSINQIMTAIGLIVEDSYL